MQVITLAKAIVLNDADEVLLLRRSKTDTERPGEWDFPGGNIEKGEDALHAVVREIKEESGLDVDPQKTRLVYAATEINAEKGNYKIRNCFAARSSGREVTLSYEHDHYQWVSIDEALAVFPHPAWGVALANCQKFGLWPER